MQLSLAQFDVDQGNPEVNLEKIANFAARASADGADLLCLPEMATTGFNWKMNETLLGGAEAVVHALAEMAASQKIAICGSFLEATEAGRMANTLRFISAQGELIHHYRKIHLFTLFHEEKHVESGNQLSVLDSDQGKIGFGICYDLRFPELFRKNTELGAFLQILPSAFPHPRLPHWETLVRARAIENQCFFVGVNQTGWEGHSGDVGKVNYFGHSMVVDPWGDVLLQGGEEEALLSVEINPGEVERNRSKLTAWDDRRPELF